MSLEKLGLIGNCQISAITDGRGGICWLCAPQPDSPSLFASLIDPDAGHFNIGAPDSEKEVVCQSEYLVNTNIVRTFVKTDSGSFEIIDFCPRFQNSDRMFRPPQIFRIVRPINGHPQVQVDCEPRWDYARKKGSVGYGSNHVSYLHGDEALRLTTNMPLTYIKEKRPFLLSKDLYFVLAYGEPFEAEIAQTAESFLNRTKRYWRTWVRKCSLPKHYGMEVIRSALALKLHVYEDTGAILAATTTSIPESPGQKRNWDYRYCWLRDSYSEIMALNVLGQTEEIEGFAEYLANLVASSKERLQPVYRISGDPLLHEETLDHLAGYRGDKPVRIGNGASAHIQNDVYGELILAISPFFFDPRFLDRELKDIFDQIIWLSERCIQYGNEPDAGIWEFRSKEKRHSFSVMLTIAGLNNAALIAKKLNRQSEAQKWHDEAQKIKKKFLQECEKSGIGIPQSLEAPYKADASSLVAASLHVVTCKDPLFLKTIETVEKRLMTPYGPLRYEGEDDFGKVNACFGLCSFWYINALTQTGRVHEAREWFEKILSLRNELGLLSEDWSTDTGELWGNFPQVYSHVGLIYSAMRLSHALENGNGAL